MSRNRSPILATLAASLALATSVPADPITRRLDIDFSRSVTSRNLSGLAARSDGRLVVGPTLRALDNALPELAWCLEPDGAGAWLVGGGPDGKIVKVSTSGGSFAIADSVDLEETNVFAICATGASEYLAGAAPGGALYLVKDGNVVARAPVGADVIWDIRHLRGDEYLVATGTPAKILKVTLGTFRDSGIVAADGDSGDLVQRGIAEWATIRDRNARRLIVTAEGRVVVGSSPRGAIYEFGADRPGQAGFILHESKDAEVADLLITPDGTLYAALVYNAPGAPDRRMTPRATPAPQPPAQPPEPVAPTAEFGGRSEVIRIARNGLPEPVVARNGVAVYKLAAFGDLLLIGAGERGEILGYDPVRKALLTFAGAPSSQVNGIAPIPGTPGKFLLLRNNFSGLAVLDFNSAESRTADTQKLELGQPSRLGLLQFSRLRDLAEADLTVEFKFGNSADENDAWSEWLPATREGGGYRLGNVGASYARLRLTLPPTAPVSAEIGRAALFHMAQNRPPAVQDFRVFPPGLGLIPMPDPPAPASLPLAQFLFPNQPLPQSSGGADQPQKNSFLGSQIVAQPGNQLVYWNMSDPDGDNLLASLSLRHIESKDWTELAAGVATNNLGFSTADLPEGPYVMKLVVSEDAPRPASDRQIAVHESDDLTVDRTPPDILAVAQSATAHAIVIRVSARDRWSLLRGARVVLNNGSEIESIFPEDGILDGQEEAFVLEILRAAATGATNAEVMVLDQAGNRTSRRIPLAP